MYKTFERYVFCVHRKQVQSYKIFIDTFLGRYASLEAYPPQNFCL